MCEKNAMVSIIMPAYNSEKYVAEAINSVLCQTYNNWELLAVDDGSTDGTGEIIDSFATLDDRIRAFHTENKGVSHARNVGLNHADGEWVAFLDSDDMLMPDALTDLLSISNHKELIMGNYIEFPNIKEMKYFTDADDIDKTELLLSSFGGGRVWGMLFKNDAVHEQFPYGLQFGEDTVFLCNQLKYCTHIATVHHIVYQYRRNDLNTLSHQTQNMRLDYVEGFCSLAGELFDNDLEHYYAYTAHIFISYIKAIAEADKLTKTEKLERINEFLKSKYFCEIPLLQVHLKSQKMHLFTVLKTGDMALIEKELGLE